MSAGDAFPRLDRGDLARPGTGIVHLGPGAFFRAFNAVYTDEAMAAAGGDWGICAVSLHSSATRDALVPQGCVYTAVTLDPGGWRHRLVGAVVRVMVAPEDPPAVIAAMADPAVRIVSLTITEKGYCHDPATGRLRLDHPAIAHDLANPAAPQSAPGLIVGALARRRAAGLPPFSVLSCDNLPGNGRLVAGVVTGFARARDPGLADWIGREGRFPSTMVDRITPATTAEDIARLAEMTGHLDLGCVLHEPFRQWVIEDDFVAGARPAWEVAGAQLVACVAGFETMKLRLLNGSHSALAYLGYLAGFETIAETVADAAFAAYCGRLWTHEILPTVAPPAGVDLGAYCDALLARYRNPMIRHRTWQIAMDGSQKLPQRLLATAADNLAAGRGVAGIALAVAAWMRYVGGRDERGRPIDVRDPLAARLRAVADGAEGPAPRVAALLGIAEVFPPALAANPGFAAAVTAAYEGLLAAGARRMVAALGR